MLHNKKIFALGFHDFVFILHLLGKPSVHFSAGPLSLVSSDTSIPCSRRREMHVGVAKRCQEASFTF